MISNRVLKKLILIGTGIVFLSYPAFDWYIVENIQPSMFMYVTAVLIGIGYIVYGALYK
jgi:hypothetical protein